ncbi:alcohol dehydrogenase catalytic domain-containing protein [Streptomyces sp. BB1-1-1]|uniref:alcohol dehydrogenase catalytic domain-containing protein n=1 Tax=Streptomyces sp. BB1-1-1 TaxID=3074430 RepID=UPI0037DA65D8
MWTRRGIPGLDLTFPAVLGWDVAGTVDAVGSEVTRFRVGDRVTSMVKQVTRLHGTYAEFVSAPQEIFAPLPIEPSMETAAAAPLTAHLGAAPEQTCPTPTPTPTPAAGCWHGARP